VLGSEFHAYDRQMSVISQDIAQNVQKTFINFYYIHEGRHEGLYMNIDNYDDATPSSSSTNIWLVDRMPQNSSSEHRKQGWVHLRLVLSKVTKVN
jgi:hypothetical protein